MDPRLIKGLLNPVRMRIIMTLISKGQCTTKDIQDELQGVAQASLYRHISKLIDTGVIKVIAEEKKRGAIEKTYELKVNPYEDINKSVEKGDKDTINELFYSFVMSLMTEFTDYIYKKDSDMIKDSVGFRSYPMNLSEAENQEFLKEFGELLHKYVSKEAKPERKLRKFSFVYTPGE